MRLNAIPKRLFGGRGSAKHPDARCGEGCLCHEEAQRVPPSSSPWRKAAAVCAAAVGDQSDNNVLYASTPSSVILEVPVAVFCQNGREISRSITRTGVGGRLRSFPVLLTVLSMGWSGWAGARFEWEQGEKQVRS